MATKDQVIEFLDVLKKTILKKNLIFIPRKKNTDYLAMSGLFVYEVERLITNLTECDYIGGPKRDDDGSEGQIWEFCTNIKGCSTYIKLKLDSDGAKCISFHNLEYPVIFPFK